MKFTRDQLKLMSFTEVADYAAELSYENDKLSEHIGRTSSGPCGEGHEYTTLVTKTWETSGMNGNLHHSDQYVVCTKCGDFASAKEPR